ncbi:DUF3747 domain-containing protein [Synechococcales cyanobacterium C]|uniref:DUF3747 domain-containing protein n=1 Tax=Petrachloros mirabilis ULC683 TaxID=2781853 RepID=A0A8K2A0U3_9CYAN|nr:DUF3747 domain-containing protein [Petrachloros mirabilis]NCJ07523.1 DUF3747 domain-containing protein [Petrachloros mirabilis ULC683]
MSHNFFSHALTGLGVLVAGSAISLSPATAVTFGQQEVDQSRFIAVAAPVGTQFHQLLVIEQISDARPCWETSGSNPVVVEPLLVNFDFTGICGRSVDSNGYSLRIDGEDLGLQYSLRVRRRDNDLVLVAAPSRSGQEEIEIGRANGFTQGFAKLRLDPGWRFTKRSFEDRVLGHIYLTRETGDLPFPDVAGDIYLAEIREAVSLGFIAGFSEDNTFRPRSPLTREQLVSMILESLTTIPNLNVQLPTQTSSNPYPDVAASRWSAAKIQFARQNQIVSGYEDGSFRPTQTVTRAEMMAVLRRTAEYVKTRQGRDTTLAQTQTPASFTDTSTHWAADVIRQMSGYCGVASALNEQGQAFAPNQSALRNYAAAATLRMLNCVKNPES